MKEVQKISKYACLLSLKFTSQTNGGLLTKTLRSTVPVPSDKEICQLNSVCLLPTENHRPNFNFPSNNNSNDDFRTNLPFLESSVRELTLNHISSTTVEKQNFLKDLLLSGFAVSKNSCLDADQCNQVSKLWTKVDKEFQDFSLTKYNKDLWEAAERGKRHRECIFRGHPGEFQRCTKDVSLKLGSIISSDLINLVEHMEILQTLQPFFQTIFPTKKLAIGNTGFFVSPKGNIGQQWHTDWIPTKSAERYTEIPPLITLVTSLKEQTEQIGGTVFGAGSHHTLPWQNLIYSKGINSYSPLLKKGQTVAFLGNCLHYGGQNKSSEDRVVLYTVLHALEKNENILPSDENIENLMKFPTIYENKLDISLS